MKQDLKDCTFIIPIKLESGDRLRNCILSTSYILHNFDTNIIIKEVDSNDYSNFEELALPILKNIIDTSNIKHIYEKSKRSDDIFHRTKILNDMILDVSTSIVVNYDCDIILPLESYKTSYDLIKNNHTDIVYPFLLGKHGEKKVKLPFTIYGDNGSVNPSINWKSSKTLLNFNNNEFINKNYSLDYLDRFSFWNQECPKGEGWAEYGMCQFFSKKTYIDGFLENENFISYGPEDVERAYRFYTLGYRIKRINLPAYHLEHMRSYNSTIQNPYIMDNTNLAQKLTRYSKDELLQYYSNQEYYVNRTK